MPADRAARGGGGLGRAGRWLDVPLSSGRASARSRRRAAVNPYLALTALAELEKGAGATDALSTALAGDEAGAFRQLALWMEAAKAPRIPARNARHGPDKSSARAWP